MFINFIQDIDSSSDSGDDYDPESKDEKLDPTFTPEKLRRSKRIRRQLLRRF